MLHDPCILGGPQQRGQNQSGPRRGRECYITPAFSGVPNNGDKIKASPKEGANATSPLHVRRSLIKGTKSKRPKRGQKCYITPAFSGVPNKGDKIKANPKQGGNATSPLHSRESPIKRTKSKPAQKRAEMLHHPCILGGPQQRVRNQSGPKRGRKCYITPAFSGVPNNGDKIKAGPKEGANATSPLHSWGAPTKATKSKRAQKRAEMLHHVYSLGSRQQRGQNQGGPKRGRKCYITPAFLQVPNKGDKIKAGQKRAEMLHHPCILGGPQQRGQNQSRPKSGRKCYITPAFSGVPKKGDKIRAGPNFGGNATSPLHSRGSPTTGTKSKRAQNRVEMLHHPCILGGPQQRGQNQSGPKFWRKCYITLAFYGVPNNGDEIKAGQKEGANAASPLHSRGSPTTGTKSKRAQNRVEMLHHPCILGGPQQRGQNQSGPKCWRKCYITPAFYGVPNNGDEIKAGQKEGANAASPLHSRGSPIKATNQSVPKRGRKCCITPAFSGVPNKGDKIKAGPKVGANAT